MPQNYVLLERIELNASAASVTFSNIPQTGYTDLKVVVSGRTDRAANGDDINISFNGSSSSFSRRRIFGTGAAAYSDTGTQQIAILDGGSDTANTFGSMEIYIPNYTSSNNKSYSVDGVSENNGTTAYAQLTAGLWSNTAAITSVTISSGNSANWVSGSTFSLYAIANSATTPAVAPKANGGNVIATDGTYWYHAFLSNGTFTPQVALSADVLVIAGGGGAGDQPGAGAGGVIYQAGKTVTTATTITVGSGGTGAATGGTPTKGNDSFFGAMKAFGGGTGYTGTPNIGGSGGGAYNTVSDFGTSNQTSNDGGTGYGNSGGSGAVTVNYRGGGGGGAGTAGKANNNPSGGAFSTGGYGGDGLNTWSAWASATGTGVSGYFAAGGGSGAVDNLAGFGGSGGGGNGGQSGTSMSIYPKKYATSGTVNTGSGGGGGGWSGDGYSQGGNGGSGIVIIRYPIAS